MASRHLRLLLLLGATVTGLLAGIVIAHAATDIQCPNRGSPHCEGTPNRDRMFGRDVRDQMQARRGNDELYGYAERDDLSGNDDQDLIYGNDGEDDLKGAEDSDLYNCGGVYCGIQGGPGPDTINGGPNEDAIWAGEGIDRIAGDEAHDYLISWDDGAGGDYVYPQSFDDCYVNQNDIVVNQCQIHYP